MTPARRPIKTLGLRDEFKTSRVILLRAFVKQLNLNNKKNCIIKKIVLKIKIYKNF